MSRALTSPAVPVPGNAARNGDFLLPFPDYPCNARSFVHLDARLLPYWHTLFDVCPSLLKLDPPEGLELFRRFMTWAYRNHPSLDWTYYVSVCRWLLSSPYKAQVTDKHIEAFLVAAAALWVASDVPKPVAWYWLGNRWARWWWSGSRGRVLAHLRLKTASNCRRHRGTSHGAHSVAKVRSAFGVGCQCPARAVCLHGRTEGSPDSDMIFNPLRGSDDGCTAIHARVSFRGPGGQPDGRG